MHRPIEPRRPHDRDRDQVVTARSIAPLRYRSCVRRRPPHGVCAGRRYLYRVRTQQGGAMDVSTTSATAANPFGTAPPPTGGQAAPSLEETVATAESALAEAQIALETSRLDLDRLTRLHHHHLGPLYDRLDQLDLLIAEAKAAMTGDPEQARRAYELRYGSSGQPTFDPLTDPLPTGEPEPAPLIDPEYASTLRFTEPVEEQTQSNDPAKTLQRLYRDLARRAHPDFTQDPREKERRNAFITRVNDAYRRADLYELQRLAEEWAVISAEGPE